MLALMLLHLTAAEKTKIAFGSCHGHLRQSNYEIFDSISKYLPDVWVWLGDVVYADLESFPFEMSEKFLPAWQRQYDVLRENPSYQRLLTTTRVTGIWDDHDFGENDSNSGFSLKKESQEMFMKFINFTVDHEGVYRTEIVNEKVRIIMLDVRYFRVVDKDVLGDVQWAWLKEQLEVEYPVTLIASGLQVNVEDRFAAYTERWDDFSRVRLLNLVKDRPGVILLTGDIHFGEILLNKCGNFPLLEVTSSGLSHTEATIYGPLAVWYIHITNALSYHSNLRVFAKHFAILEIDFDENLLTTSLRDTQGQVLIEEHYQLSYLTSKLETLSTICLTDPKTRHYNHLFSCILILHLPIFLISTSFLIFLRKYSNSY
jgi:alkaline phosphatase D